MSLPLLLIGISTFVALVLLIIQIFIGRQRSSAEAMLAQHLAGHPVRMRSDANYHGRESDGADHKGNGTLVLTDEALVFRLWSHSEELEVPIAEMTKIDTTNSHLGKRSGRKLLRVSYRDGYGREDVAAWWVRDLRGWLAALGVRSS